jgi:predicted Zn finger-like uncharacterized protein
MSRASLTRCPGCATVFRVTAGQLALREGQVRCGACRAVFDANDHLVPDDGRVDETAPATKPTEAGDTLAEPSTAAQPPAAQFKVEPSASDVSTADEPIAEAPAIETPPTETPTTETPASDDFEAVAPLTESDEDREAETATLERPPRYEWKPRKPVREQSAVLYGAAIVMLVLALAVQLVLEYRDRLAAHAPFTRPMLASVCALLGCTVAPLHDAVALSIDASDLQADPAHRGLLQLTATIRNRAAYAIAYPYLELTLTDASDQVVARRALAPAEYVSGTSNPAAGIPGNGETVVRLFVDASATSQAGYRLYLFYP